MIQKPKTVKVRVTVSHRGGPEIARYLVQEHNASVAVYNAMINYHDHRKMDLDSEADKVIVRTDRFKYTAEVVE